jgi:hypothetical protein
LLVDLPATGTEFPPPVWGMGPAYWIGFSYDGVEQLMLREGGQDTAGFSWI